MTKSTKSNFGSTDDEVVATYGSLDKTVLLPKQLRLAWATSAIEKLIPLFSTFIVSRYQLVDAIDFSWRFALSGTDNAKARNELR